MTCHNSITFTVEQLPSLQSVLLEKFDADIFMHPGRSDKLQSEVETLKQIQILRMLDSHSEADKVALFNSFTEEGKKILTRGLRKKVSLSLASVATDYTKCGEVELAVDSCAKFLLASEALAGTIGESIEATSHRHAELVARSVKLFAELVATLGVSTPASAPAPAPAPIGIDLGLAHHLLTTIRDGEQLRQAFGQALHEAHAKNQAQVQTQVVVAPASPPAPEVCAAPAPAPTPEVCAVAAIAPAEPPVAVAVAVPEVVPVEPVVVATVAPPEVAAPVPAPAPVQEQAPVFTPAPAPVPQTGLPQTAPQVGSSGGYPGGGFPAQGMPPHPGQGYAPAPQQVVHQHPPPGYQMPHQAQSPSPAGVPVGYPPQQQQAQPQPQPSFGGAGGYPPPGFGAAPPQQQAQPQPQAQQQQPQQYAVHQHPAPGSYPPPGFTAQGFPLQ